MEHNPMSAGKILKIRHSRINLNRLDIYMRISFLFNNNFASWKYAVHGTKGREDAGPQGRADSCGRDYFI